MKVKVFLDVDVIIDTLTDRLPFSEYSSQLLTLIEKKQIHGFTSSVAIANIYYYLKKVSNRNTAIGLIKQLRLIVGILPVDDNVITKSLESKMTDFEDAIQANTAFANDIETLITRNKRDFTKSKLKIYSPQEFLKIMEIE